MSDCELSIESFSQPGRRFAGSPDASLQHDRRPAGTTISRRLAGNCCLAYGHSIAGQTENYGLPLGLYQTWGKDKGKKSDQRDENKK